jgi:L-alanine-DL-glutamate epimerase-like enolase superfamily enzyme
MPIAAGENEFSVAGFERLVTSGAVDVLQPELVKFGGLTPARAVGDLAEQAGLALCPHNYSLGPSFVANVHWAVTARPTRWLEVPWLPAGQSFPSGLDVPSLIDGCIAAPTLAGLSAPAHDA